MINQKNIVYAKLEELEKEDKAKQVCEEGSQDWSKLPAVTYLELNNAECEVADDEEYSSDLAIKADVWGKSSSEVSKLAMQVVAKMRELGYARTLYLDENNLNRKIKHKTMRFEKEEILD